MSIHQFLKFKPILKEKIWGGKKLINLLNKKSDKTFCSACYHQLTNTDMA